MVQKKIEKAKSLLILDHPFFGSLLLRMKTKEDERFPTMGTDGKEIRYSKKFVKGITVEELIGVFAHEVLHVALLHHTRIKDRNQTIWNMACDLAINPILKDSGFSLPVDVLYEEKLKEKSADEIYNLLIKNAKKVSIKIGKEGRTSLPGTGESEGGGGLPQGNIIGEVVRPKSPKDPSKNASSKEIEQMEQEIKVAVQQSLNVAKMRGKVPRGLDLQIEELYDPEIPWKEVLSRFLTEKARNDYTWVKPNQRYTFHGIYLPTLESPELGEVVVAFDTSGSVSKKELTMMASEVMEILSLYQEEPEIRFIYIDAKVCGHQKISASDFPEKFEPKGGGGTNFKPAFEWLEEKGVTPNALIYFTDGYCDEFPESPEYPTLWVLTEKNKSFEPPFGETATINV